jgi:hypothetical protein
VYGPWVYGYFMVASESYGLVVWYPIVTSVYMYMVVYIIDAWCFRGIR